MNQNTTIFLVCKFVATLFQPQLILPNHSLIQVVQTLCQVDFDQQTSPQNAKPFYYSLDSTTTKLYSVHCSDATWASWHLKSPATWLFAQQLVQFNEENKASHHWPFERRIHSTPEDSPFERRIHSTPEDSPHKGPVIHNWIPLTKSQ